MLKKIEVSDSGASLMNFATRKEKIESLLSGLIELGLMDVDTDGNDLVLMFGDASPNGFTLQYQFQFRPE